MRTVRRVGVAAALAALGLAGLPLVASPAAAAGVVELTSFGTPYSENFNSLASSGTANTAVPVGWEFSESGTNANTTYRAGTGSDNTGDTYSFGASGNTERAFGGLRSGTLIPLIGAQFRNAAGTITSLAVTYTGEQWRLGQNTTGRAADRLEFQLSTDATSLTTGAWTDYDSLDFSSPVVAGTVGALNGNVLPNQTALSFTITGLSIPAGTTFWLRWADTDLIPGADDGLSVDDFTLTAFGGPTLPSLSVDDVTLAEGNSGTTTATFTVSLSAAAGAGGVTFDIATDDASASSASDYTARSLVGQTIPAGSSTYTFAVDVAGDTLAEPDETFLVDVTNVTGANVGDAQGVGTIQNDDAYAIREIQGATHISPLNGQVVRLSPSVVTGLRTSGSTRGFYLQDQSSDAVDATSEGLFVFTGSTSNPAALVAVGDLVQVTGRVSEFRPAATSLTITELVGPLTITQLSSGNPLPAPITIGTGGRVPPTTVIEDDATGSVETSGVFDPATDGIDFYESLEGMLVQVDDAVAVGPRSDFGTNREIAVLANNGAGGGVRTSRGGIIIRPTDFNPERIILNDLIAGAPTLPAANVGDGFPGATVGVIDYTFGNFKLEVTTLPSLVSGGLTEESADAATTNELAVGTFNVENLAPSDPPAKFARLAALIVQNLKAPDILAVEEIQDNNGTTNDGTVDASTTYGLLIAAVQAAGGPTYQFRQIDPVNGQDGGAPGGNIRQGFLFRTDRGLAFVDRPGGSSTTGISVIGTGAGTQLSASPGRINPADAAFNASRKPLAGEFTYNGRTLFVVANHFNSKGGDNPLFGHLQPPVRVTEVQRRQQAQIVHDFVEALTNANSDAAVVVLGDLNDFQFSDMMTTLKGTVLNALIDTLPASEQYSYVFEGNSQALDHILVSDSLNDSRAYEYDVVHVNAEFADQASDHDPQVVRLRTYAWSGFLGPVDNPPVVNTVSAGRAIPVKFSLGGNEGLNIFAAGSPSSTRVSCTGVVTDDIEQTVTAGNSSLSYDAATDQYTYVWATEKGWAGTCRQLTVKLADGTSHVAMFRFR